MGATHVTVTIRNPADPARHWTGRFLVDTGAFDSLVPRRHLEEIGLHPLARETYVLADGSPIDVDTTVGRIEFMGKIVGGTLLFGDGDAEPLLGVTALESGGFEVDPRTRQLEAIAGGSAQGQEARGKSPAAFERRCIPRGLPCSSVEYVQYAPSSRLATRAPRRSRCHAAFRHGLLAKAR